MYTFIYNIHQPYFFFLLCGKTIFYTGGNSIRHASRIVIYMVKLFLLFRRLDFNMKVSSLSLSLAGSRFTPPSRARAQGKARATKVKYTLRDWLTAVGFFLRWKWNCLLFFFIFLRSCVIYMIDAIVICLYNTRDRTRNSRCITQRAPRVYLESGYNIL